MKHVKKSIKELERDIRQKQKALEHLKKAVKYHNTTKKSTKLNWSLAILLIPVVIFTYVILQNFILSQEFNTLTEFESQTKYLSPAERVSFEEAGAVKAISGLTYFDAIIPNGADSIQIAMRVKEPLPKDAVISIGAKINESWSYDYHTVYNPKVNITGIADSDHYVFLITNFTLNESTYVKNGKLNMIINAPFAGKNNQSLTIDWINVKVHKNGIFKR